MRPGTARTSSSPRRMALGAHAGADADARRQQRVVDVEDARQLQRDGGAELLVPGHQEAGTVLGNLDVVGVDVAGFADANAHFLARQRLEGLSDALVVHVVDDVLHHAAGEEAHLRLKVFVHVPEIIQVIL